MSWQRWAGFRHVVLEAARGEDTLATWTGMKACGLWLVLPAMNGRKFNRQQKAFLRELRSATSLAFVVPSVGQERRVNQSEVEAHFSESFATRDMMEASANDQVTALCPVRSSREIMSLMLGAFALFRQESKIKKCAGYQD
ncbi:MAG TPA: hypothetical protein VKB96_05910 [Gammaproteobacteria bacterium]|nr:hypothetical protein [Gammaproteobacteria bacterium]